MSENLALQKEAQNADQLAYEINFIKKQTLENVLKASIDIGERLSAAKELVPHGQWSDWLKEKVDYSQSTANNFMRIFREYGDEQISLSGKSKSQTFASLNYSQAVALFALPEHQREEFVETHDVSEMSARQLKEAIAAQKAAEAERDQAKRERDRSEERVREALKEIDEAKSRETETYQSVRSLQEELQKEQWKAKAISVKTNKEAEEAKKKINSLKKELNEANSKMKELTSASAEISEKEKAAIEEKVKQKYEGRVNQLTLDVETERKRAETIAAEKAALEAKAAQARSDSMVKLNLLFEQSQKTLQDIKRLIEDCPEEQREKLNGLILQTLSRIFGGN